MAAPAGTTYDARHRDSLKACNVVLVRLAYPTIARLYSSDRILAQHLRYFKI
jgi:hypothetical protein